MTAASEYRAALRALEERGRFGIHLGLGRVRALLRELNDPQLGIRGALVAGTNGTTWREQVSLFATLAIVGLPVWLIHWRASVTVSAAEAHSLARRLYLYVSLIGAVLALIGALAGALYRLINVALGRVTSPPAPIVRFRA